MTIINCVTNNNNCTIRNTYTSNKSIRNDNNNKQCNNAYTYYIGNE